MFIKCMVILVWVIRILQISAFVTQMNYSRNKKTSSTSPLYVDNSNQSMTQTASLKEAKEIISSAISAGAPAYNRGDVEGCAKLYTKSAQTLVQLELPANLQSDLEKCISTTYSSSNEQAWGFRRVFDKILEYNLPFIPFGDSHQLTHNYSMEKLTDAMISSQPYVVNDNVMGGMSEGKWDQNFQTFSGRTSLANNGGFSSLRWRMNRVQNWSYAKGIYLKVKHSNPEHTFRIIVKDTTCEQIRGSNFKTVFCNPSSVDEPIFIPFHTFDTMEQMGRTVGKVAFNYSAVTELGIMAIKPTVVGNFELQIKEWGLYYFL